MERAVATHAGNSYRRVSIHLANPAPWVENVSVVTALIFTADGQDGLQGRQGFQGFKVFRVLSNLAIEQKCFIITMVQIKNKKK